MTIYVQDVNYAGGIPHIVENDTRKRKKCLLPCTPLAVVKILEHIKVYDEALAVGDQMKDKTVCVINRSEVVGRPLAALLANDGANVYSFDISGVYLMQRGKISEVCLRTLLNSVACPFSFPCPGDITACFPSNPLP